MHSMSTAVGLFFGLSLIGSVAAQDNPAPNQTASPQASTDGLASATATLAATLGEPKSIQVDLGNGDLATLNYLKRGNRAIFEGDIIIGNADQLEFAAQVGPVKLFRKSPDDTTPFGYMAKSVLFGSRKWLNNTVPYTIDPTYASSDLILQAISAWEHVTKVHFVERTAANMASYHSYVYFTKGTDPRACLSEGVGMQGGRQLVELVDGCQLGQIIHEIGHVLGLDHEQNRSDRDKYVKVIFQNIVKGYEGQFVQRPSLYMDLGTYDYDSIMHYEQNAFGINGGTTIMPVGPLPPGVMLGQRDHISQGDISAIGTVYK
jgi:hypothetical protein